MAQNWERFRDADEPALIELLRTRSPRMLADGLWWVFPFNEPRIPAERVLEIFVDGLAERPQGVRDDFAGFVFSRELSTTNGIPIVDDLVDRGLLECSAIDYLRYVTRGVLAGGERAAWERAAPALDATRAARDDARFRETVLWQLFTTEGGGRTQYQNWHPSLGEYLLRHPELRERALDEALGALLRDFSAIDIAGYLVVLKILTPTPDEVRARQTLLIRILMTTPGTGVTAAQELLATLAGSITEFDDLAAATAVVAARTEKKQTLAQLALLERVAAAQPGAAATMRAAAAAFLASPNLQVVERARAFIGTDAPAPGPEPGAWGRNIVVPGPRRLPRPLTVEPVRVIDDADELAALLARLLENPTPAEDLVSAATSIERLRKTRPATAAALLARAQPPDWEGSTPGEVGALVLRWLTGSAPALPAEDVVHESDYSLARAADGFHAELVREVAVPFWHPRVLFRQWINEITRGALRRPAAKTVDAIRAGGAPHSPRWRRVPVLSVDPGGFHHGMGWSTPDPPYVVWADDGARKGPGVARVFDLSDLAERQYVREGYLSHCRWEQTGLPDWWRWLLVRAPDHLAAHAIPSLIAATHFPNVTTASAVDALGAAHTPLGPPSWDALALALADRSAEGRARAAEAVAALAASGFLEPEALGTALTELLELKVMPAARVAAALDDAASISAIGGWRVLETLTGMLPRLSGPATARFVEVTSRLAHRFGVAVEIPALFADKRSGALGSALRALAAVSPAPTAEVVEAARQAEAALA